jgi:hypothetical protein
MAGRPGIFQKAEIIDLAGQGEADAIIGFFSVRPRYRVIRDLVDSLRFVQGSNGTQRRCRLRYACIQASSMPAWASASPAYPHRQPHAGSLEPDLFHEKAFATLSRPDALDPEAHRS